MKNLYEGIYFFVTVVRGNPHFFLGAAVKLTFSHFLDFLLFFRQRKEEQEDDESKKELELLTRISRRLKVFNKQLK